MTKRKKIILTVLAVIVLLGILGASAVFGINAYVKHAGGANIVSVDEACTMEYVDCIIVLGCQVRADKSPSDMLKDRLDHALMLYEGGASAKLLMSGDHGRTDYNEVAAMKKRAIEEGVPSSDVFMDHAGFSTYESVYRAKEVFGAKKILIVTQEYHLYRALHVAEALGVEAYGVSADLHSYWGQSQRDLREVAARCKDVLYGIFRPEPTYLGQPIPLTGDGDLTNDDLSVFEEGQIT